MMCGPPHMNYELGRKRRSGVKKRAGSSKRLPGDVPGDPKSCERRARTSRAPFRESAISKVSHIFNAIATDLRADDMSRFIQHTTHRRRTVCADLFVSQLASRENSHSKDDYIRTRQKRYCNNCKLY